MLNADSFLTILKLLSLLLTTVFGLAGQVFDFRDQSTGKVTKWGRRNLVGLVIGLIIGVASWGAK
jgi:hypothetical protein